MKTRNTKRHAGFSSVEVAISTLLVGVLLVAALNSIGVVIGGRLDMTDGTKATHLLHQLMSEILGQDYEEPNGSPSFGIESPEIATVRSSWDDVDDYHLWSASPPQDRAGTPLSGLNGWQREVLVAWADPGAPALPSAGDQGVKRITVTVRLNGDILARGTALRTDRYTPE